ncbi:siroheme synthase CysG [Enterovirga rhinocerotis]|uniref:Uroporphyrinogen-III C-methyltransferase n=1 Tax=Enterovirga rhinocerotis TaxID=1339210 RepID=A0A4R7CCK0_9HYPH|nr:siroheme synthase CysG [Enterovirga rhinocerotis]TDR94537.1 uroporphyrinogen-III C-methyltransferase [Enterovirga rhinocerotis]
MSFPVAPVIAAPPRLAPLAKLPVFVDLAGRRVVMVGGAEPVVWKSELLAAAGARVEVIAEAPHPDLLALAAANEAIRVARRTWEPGDLDGAALVVADIDEPDEAFRLREAARERGLLLNVIDRPAFCDFQFGTIVNRSPVVIGIMTDGAAPILGQAIRRRIEAVVPASVASWSRSAKAFRERLRALLPARTDRRAFWERFADASLSSTLDEREQGAALERMAAAVGPGSDGPGRIGEVVIVGAGPGDPELLTLKAMRELQAADVIVYDRLVTPGILELGRREARRVHVGKEGHGASCRQEDISALLVDLAFAGERVVRLKGGDPAIFGRTGEEVSACQEAGVPVRIVPGVTTASAASAALATSLTHRDHARRVQFVTGHDRSGRLPDDLDFAALADPRATLVVYMARRTAAALAKRLIAQGLAAATPAIAMSDVSRPGAASECGTLASLAEAGIGLPEGRPVIVLIGEALRNAPSAPAQAAAEPFGAAATTALRTSR